MSGGACSRCGGRTVSDLRNGVELLVCTSCGAGTLDPRTLAKLLDPGAPKAPPPPEHGYPVNYPQQDVGHVASRPLPTFGPAWGTGPADPNPDAHGLLR